jgi:hypothetical protein
MTFQDLLQPSPKVHFNNTWFGEEPPEGSYFRYEGKFYTGEECVYIYCEAYPVLRTTPHGVWVQTWKEQFILEGEGKRYAYPTRELAWASFLIRKARAVGWCELRLRAAQRILEATKTFGDTRP